MQRRATQRDSVSVNIDPVCNGIASGVGGGFAPKAKGKGRSS